MPPQTRSALLNKILAYLGDPDRHSNLLWLKAEAGVGKSAVIQCLAEAERESGTLGSALFFSRLRLCDDLTRALPTIAYELALKFPAYLSCLRDLRRKDPQAIGKALHTQFEKLIVQPVAKQNLIAGKGHISIFLDALDQCSEEFAQCKIVELIDNFLYQHPAVPIIWVISSRPVSHLQASFSNTLASQESISVDGDEGRADVERYMRAEFERIRKRYPFRVPSTWPTENQLRFIFSRAAGFFAFATELMNFIRHGNTGNPVGQLELALTVLEPIDPSTIAGNPFVALNAIRTLAHSSLASVSTFDIKNVCTRADTSRHDICTHVPFPCPFVLPPRIAHGIRELDIGKGANIRIESTVDSVTTTSANYHVLTWADTKVNSGVVDSLNLAPYYHEFLNGEVTRNLNVPDMADPPSVRVNFSRPFASPPTVVSFFNRFDIDKHSNWRLKTSATHINEKGFILNIETWGDTILYGATVGWVAYSSGLPNVWSASVNVMEVRPWTQPRAKASKAVTFPSFVSFHKAPNVFVALNWFDLSATQSFRLRAFVDDVSMEGLTWHIDTWGDSVVYSAGATIIAID
ncbi:hypothetical protein NP233_g5885 [Leucocoprinus birnbaumii]|uniref:NACHT domain-containing protein n=1 Tax=Leucocoprinus birnbaumii TaxID=56174 RepID=A0AAD5YW20_9AGAR|nr:hypothetical protein NP233_g5885 [Leucocoprinus birnbaumii]